MLSPTLHAEDDFPSEEIIHSFSRVLVWLEPYLTGDRPVIGVIDAGGPVMCHVKILSCENVINAVVGGKACVGSARSPSRQQERIVEFFGQRMIGKGSRCVIEVAADDHGVRTVFYGGFNF